MREPSQVNHVGVPMRPFACDLVADKRAAATLHSLRRRAYRAELISDRGRTMALISSLVAPLRAARVALRGIAEFGDSARRYHDVSTARQFAWLWWLNLRHLYDAATVYRYSLFYRERVLPQPLYFCGISTLYGTVIPRIAPERAAVLGDKRRFAIWCEEQGIPTPLTFMEFDQGQVSRSGIESLQEPSCDLFAKWAARVGGDDTLVWMRASAQWLDSEQRRWSFNEILDFLKERSKSGAVMLQPRLVNHPAIRDLSPNALSTIRIMTLRRPREEPTPLAGVLRMGTGKSNADNFSQGGIAASIDFETGTLGVAISLDEQNRTCEHEFHPDTGALIAGRELPGWQEAVALALNAHSRIGDIPCVGWDVALLESGPILLEGNWNPGIKLLQLATRTPLLVTAFARTYAAWLAEPDCVFDDRWIVEHMHWGPTGSAGRGR